MIAYVFRIKCNNNLILKKMKKFLKITLIIASVVFAGYNVSTNQKAEVLSSLAMANVEALADDEDTEIQYMWSDPISCPGLFSGSYCVCQKNGKGNSCSSPGAVTCDCGRNC